MARQPNSKSRAGGKRPVESYEHKDKQRLMTATFDYYTLRYPENERRVGTAHHDPREQIDIPVGDAHPTKGEG